VTRTLVGAPDPQRPRNEVVWTSGTSSMATTSGWIVLNRKM
jgi:hypothetical protein